MDPYSGLDGVPSLSHGCRRSHACVARTRWALDALLRVACPVRIAVPKSSSLQLIWRLLGLPPSGRFPVCHALSEGRYACGWDICDGAFGSGLICISPAALGATPFKPLYSHCYVIVQHLGGAHRKAVLAPLVSHHQLHDGESYKHYRKRCQKFRPLKPDENAESCEHYETHPQDRNKMPIIHD